MHSLQAGLVVLSLLGQTVIYVPPDVLPLLHKVVDLYVIYQVLPMHILQTQERPVITEICQHKSIY